MTDRHTLPPYSLRMPTELRERLESLAKESRRSLNAEIVARLEISIAEPLKPDPANSSAELLLSAREIIERLAGLVEQQSSSPSKK